MAGKSNFYRILNSTSLVSILLCGMAAAQSQNEAQIDVPSQDLAKAVEELSHETGVPVAVLGRYVDGKTSKSVSGPMSVRKALLEMVADTGLVVRETGDGSLIVTASNNEVVSQNVNEDSFDLGTLVLEALLPGTIEDTYVAADTFTATRTDRPLKKVPQSVQSLTRRSLEDTGVKEVADAYDHLAGVNRDNNTGGLFGDQVLVRGLAPDNILINGDRSGRPVTLDTANVERIEAVRGPTATLFGAGEAGGTINVVTKQPLAEQFNEAGISYNFDFGNVGQQRSIARLELDSGGPLNADGSVRYRFNLAAEGGDSFRRDIDSTLYFGSGAIEVDLTPNTIANFEFIYQDRDEPFDRGVFFVNGGLPLSRGFNLAEGDTGSIAQTYYSIAARLEHRFTDQLRGRFNVSYSKNDFDGTGAQVNTITGSLVTINNRAFLGDYTYLTVQPELVYEFSAGGTDHTVLFGVDYTETTAELDLDFGVASAPLDVFNPVFPVVRPPVDPNGLMNFDASQRVESLSFYIQDEVEIGNRLTLVAGARYEDIEGTQDIFAFGTAVGGRTRISDSDTTFRLGAVYALSDIVSGYASYSESFRFGGTQGIGFQDTNGNPIEPERGESYELGLKLESLDGSIVGTASIFRIEKDNVIERAPGFSFDRAVNIGKIRSDGFELDVSGDLGNGLSFGATYTYLDASVVEPGGAAPAGSTLRNVPEHSASLRLGYELPSDWRVFGAVVYESSKLVSTALVAPELPSYIRVDFGAAKTLSNGGEISLFIENVFDEVYFPTSAGPLNVSVGDPMNATLAYTMRF